jgi:hypothetical protein
LPIPSNIRDLHGVVVGTLLESLTPIPVELSPLNLRISRYFETFSSTGEEGPLGTDSCVHGTVRWEAGWSEANIGSQACQASIAGWMGAGNTAVEAG